MTSHKNWAVLLKWHDFQALVREVTVSYVFEGSSYIMGTAAVYLMSYSYQMHRWMHDIRTWCCTFSKVFPCCDESITWLLKFSSLWWEKGKSSMAKEDIQLRLRTEHCILMQLLDHILPFFCAYNSHGEDRISAKKYFANNQEECLMKDS